MPINNPEEKKEKNRIAMTSVIAAVFLTSFKLIIGFSTNSLGILSEAAHSGLDLVAAFVTLLAVRVSSKPADDDHQYGHGKVENLSALIETILLLITCGWIIFEVYKRLTGEAVQVDVSFWSFLVIIVSIIVDISRSRALMRIAKKYNSQALEADALHFSTDIYSSAVVLAGLFAYSFGIHFADSIAALIVAVIVIFISLRLGKRSIDVLMDKAPVGVKEKVEAIVVKLNGIYNVHDIRVRNSGAETLVELNIHVDPSLDINSAHAISETVEEAVAKEIRNCKVVVHIEPEENT
jgi:cation diffusion facilitator family transporter